MGIFGELAGGAQLLSQVIGILTVGIFCSAISFLLFFVLKKTMGIRVGKREEIEGLDVWEHGMRAYPDLGPPD